MFAVHTTSQPQPTGQPPYSKGIVSIYLLGNNCITFIWYSYTKHNQVNFEKVCQLLHEVEHTMLLHQYIMPYDTHGGGHSS